MRSIKFLLTVAMFLMPTFINAQGNVAVLIYPKDKQSERFTNRAQSYFETILFDNGFEVLDQDKADELKDVWQQFEDPSYFITAEDILANAEKYRIDGIFRIFLTVDTFPGLADYHSATANVDLRFVDANAEVTSAVSPVMGGKGNPPSDGLSVSSAGLNAVQRAIDKASAEFGLELLETKSPRLVDLFLVPASAPTQNVELVTKRPLASSDVSIAPMEDEKWTAGQATCTALSDDRSMGIVGEYIASTDKQLTDGPRDMRTMGGGMGGMRSMRSGPRTSKMSRVWGSRLHILDLDSKAPLLDFEVDALGRRSKTETNDATILGCQFLGSWRFVVALTGNYLTLIDTERGRLNSKVDIDYSLSEDDSLEVYSTDRGYLLAVVTGRTKRYYRVSTKENG